MVKQAQAINSDSARKVVGNSLILHTILSKLPLKTVCRFRSVCKAWKTLISSQNFSTLYSRNPRFTLLLGLSKYSGFHFIEIGLNGVMSFTKVNLPEFPTRRIVSCSNGLICSLSENYIDSYIDVFVSNPVYGDIAMLPRSYNKFRLESNCSFGIEYDFNAMFGFGFCAKSDTYKILKLSSKEIRGSGLLFEILTMGVDREWRSLEESSFNFELSWPSFDITHEGVLYSVCRGCNESDPYNIFAFDLEKEKGGLIPFPLELTEWASLWLFGNDLCLTTNEDKDCIVNWVMKNCGKSTDSSWSKSIWNKPWSSIRGGPITKLTNGDILMQTKNDSELLSFHENTMMISRITDKVPAIRCFFGYVPNFLPLSMQGDIEQEFCDSLNIGNVIEMLETSETYSYTYLKEAALSFLVRNIRDIVFSKRFETFTDDNPLLFLEVTRAVISETNDASPAPESESSPPPEELNYNK